MGWWVRWAVAVVACLCSVPVWAAQPQVAWVLFQDKPDGRGGRVVWQADGRQASGAQLDLPVDAAYVERVAGSGARLRFASAWLNGVSVDATTEQLRVLAAQPFVRSIRPVARCLRPQPEPSGPLASGAGKSVLLPDYGVSFEQLAQTGIVPLQGLGYDGTGVRVGVLDNGFEYRTHPALRNVQVVAQRDFVNGDDNVTDQTGQPVTGDETRSTQNIHGAQVLSVMAGSDPGEFMGGAPRAQYVLAKTEDNDTELPAEEDRWVAGLEWVAAQGATVVNSSLGYNLFDDGTGYTYQDMDGATALTTLAAQAAARKGIVVVVAAGNEGATPWRYVDAPADGADVISVGSVNIPYASDEAPVVSVTSSRGPTSDGRIKPDVVAPGEGVVVADIRGLGYMRTNGTSFAAPLVSSACALLRQVHPDWTPSQVLSALRTTATDLGAPGPDNTYGWGQVDALRASGLQVTVPARVVVGQPFPNPVRGDVVYFPLQVVARQAVTISLFDAAGSLVYTQSATVLPGDHTGVQGSLRWDLASTESRRGPLANGVLLYRIQTPSAARTGRIALVRAHH